jgi:predicted transcriptional regulator
MKTFTFRYDPTATPDDLFARVERAATKGIVDIRKDETSSNSIHAILSSMTEGRLQVFYAIADQKPTSMYQLAQLLKRDQANVLRDLKSLEAMKLVKLVEEKDGDRERLRPVANYDRIVFDFGAAGVSGKRKRAASV